MKSSFFFNKTFENIYSKPDKNSEVISQILYGEKFLILKKKNDWIKIKTKFDNYEGYIKKSLFHKIFNPTYKIYHLKEKIYKKIENKFHFTGNYLSFGSNIKLRRNLKDFVEFDNNKWVKKKNLKKINHSIKDYKKIFKKFINIKYKWGGKSYNGIDCSGLLQIFFYYNNIYCPRDTIKQIPFFKKKKSKLGKITKDLIFWKGHVAINLDKFNLIHAYGPKKKVLIMNKKKTISKIHKDTKLKPILIK